MAGDTGQYAYEGLGRVIHERARLSILTSLIAHPAGRSFKDLKRLCDLTDGNLNRHLQVLKEAGLVEMSKDHAGERAATYCRLSPLGRDRYLDYLATLEQVVRDAAEAGERRLRDDQLVSLG